MNTTFPHKTDKVNFLVDNDTLSAVRFPIKLTESHNKQRIIHSVANQLAYPVHQFYQLEQTPQDVDIN